LKLLLDTHVVLWWLANDPTLAPDARSAIADADDVTVSTASVWEISLKASLGKLDAPDDLGDQLIRHQFAILPIHLNHALYYRALAGLHRDPFDRMLVSQAHVEGLTIVTRDANIPTYGVPILPA